MTEQQKQIIDTIIKTAKLLGRLADGADACLYEGSGREEDWEEYRLWREIASLQKINLEELHKCAR